MRNLRDDVQALRAQAARGATLEQLMKGVGEALKNHPEELTQITASYRFRANDTGMSYAFSLDGGRYRELEDGAPVSVSVSGSQENLMRIIRGETNPLKALLLGRVKIQGSKEALLALGAFL